MFVFLVSMAASALASALAWRHLRRSKSPAKSVAIGFAAGAAIIVFSLFGISSLPSVRHAAAMHRLASYEPLRTHMAADPVLRAVVETQVREGVARGYSPAQIEESVAQAILIHVSLRRREHDPSHGGTIIFPQQGPNRAPREGDGGKPNIA